MEAGKVFKEYREKAGLSQPAVAKKLGYKCGQYISNFERGVTTPSLKIAKRLCAILKMPKGVAKEAYLKDFQAKLQSSGL